MHADEERHKKTEQNAINEYYFLSWVIVKSFSSAERMNNKFYLKILDHSSKQQTLVHIFRISNIHLYAS